MIRISKGDISLEIEEPGVGYCLSRFDWTGKIVQMFWKNIPFCTSEVLDGNPGIMGRGFFNEFGIDHAIGYEETKVGEFFPKIGVGSLLKESDQAYDFFSSYKINQYKFTIHTEKSRVHFQCINDSGKYPFVLNKEIILTDRGFRIDYLLENKGILPIETTEYVHNFLSPAGDPVSESNRLIFHNAVDSEQFRSGLNPGGIMTYEENEIRWTKTPQSDFFYESISNPVSNDTVWTLINDKRRLGIRESVDFEPTKINLWGRAHVISPEVFKDIRLVGGESDRWTREYQVFSL